MRLESNDIYNFDDPALLHSYMTVTRICREAYIKRVPKQPLTIRYPLRI